MEYHSIQKRTKLLNIIFIIILGILLILMAASRSGTVSAYVICIILIFIAAFAKNSTVINEKCVDNYTSFMGLKLHGRWRWKDVSYISIDYTRAAPNALVTFKKRRTRGSRTAIFEPGCLQQMVDWVVANNPDIRIDTKGPHNLKVKKQSPKANAKAVRRGRKLARKVY